MKRSSHGSGAFELEQLARCGEGTVIEPGVLIFHPYNVEFGENVYVGHQTILKGYHKNKLVIGDGSWIGQQCFFHSAGGIEIGSNVGIGPGAKIITSYHGEDGIEVPILHSTVAFAAVKIENDADLGVGCIILPGVIIGQGVQVGAGAVVTRDVAPFDVVIGVPARVVRNRRGSTG